MEIDKNAVGVCVTVSKFGKIAFESCFFVLVTPNSRPITPKLAIFTPKSNAFLSIISFRSLLLLSTAAGLGGPHIMQRPSALLQNVSHRNSGRAREGGNKKHAPLWCLFIVLFGKTLDVTCFAFR